MDLNLMPQEEEHETIDLNLMPQEEDDEGINLNWIPEKEEPQVAENVAMDLNLMPQEEDDEDMNWMPQEDEGKEDEAQEEEDEVMNWILQEKRRELSDKERHGVYFAGNQAQRWVCSTRRQAASLKPVGHKCTIC